MAIKPVRFFRHVACEPPGYLGSLLDQRGHPYEVLCIDEGIDVLRDLESVAGLVFMGGPGNVAEPTEWMCQELDLIRAAAERGIPVMGICLGAQLISRALGGEVSRGEKKEIGWHPVEWFEESLLAQHWFRGLPRHFEVFQWHEHTYTVPPGAVALARSDCAEQQAFAAGNILALQFHLEITPRSIQGIVSRYPGDLERVSECVQDAEVITADLEARVRSLYKAADLVFGRWLEGVYGKG